MSVKSILDLLSSFEDRYIPSFDDLAAVVSDLKRMGYRIVLTQGVYDLLHLGHIKYLEAAKACADILVVGIDSDAWARSRKGPTRPIVPQDERLQMLVSLRSVDIVTVIDGYGEGYRDLIEVIRPDVLIISETTSDISEDRMEFFRQNSGEVKKLPPQATVSTTGRIRNLMVDGAVEHLRGIHQSLGETISALEKGKGGGQ